jgi:hypothetical protein
MGSRPSRGPHRLMPTRQGVIAMDPAQLQLEKFDRSGRNAQSGTLTPQPGRSASESSALASIAAPLCASPRAGAPAKSWGSENGTIWGWGEIDRPDRQS